jgi:hypothetical protein
MDTRYADAIVVFEEAVSSACEKANRAGVTDKELVEELRRLASALEKELK